MVTVKAGAGTSGVGHVVHRLFPNVGRGAVVAHQEVLVVAFEASVVELGPSTADVGRVLPH